MIKLPSLQPLPVALSAPITFNYRQRWWAHTHTHTHTYRCADCQRDNELALSLSLSHISHTKPTHTLHRRVYCMCVFSLFCYLAVYTQTHTFNHALHRLMGLWVRLCLGFLVLYTQTHTNMRHRKSFVCVCECVTTCQLGAYLNYHGWAQVSSESSPQNGPMLILHLL